MGFRLQRAAHYLLLLLLGTSFNSVAADEQPGRPWGRMDNSMQRDASQKEPSGYRGRYNPWGSASRQEEDGVESTPRYREPIVVDTDRYRRVPNAAQWAYQQPPAYNSGVPNNYGSPYGSFYPGDMQGMAPWHGGINPNYGNYWNDPYGTLQPDTGLLWSDMWRW